MTMAIAREHLPADRVPGMIGRLSVCASAGVGLGYPLSGLFADLAGSAAAFWFGAGVSAAALLCGLVVLPRNSRDAGPGLDATGAVLLTLGLIGLLLTIAQGSSWGWASPAGLASLAGGVIFLGVWVVQQLRSSRPLVALRLLRHPSVRTGNACVVVLSVAMYMYVSGITAFVQTPRSMGYGFSASVAAAGLCLVPFSVLSLAASQAVPRLTRIVGARALLPLGSLVVAAAGMFFALFHDAWWTALVMMAVVGTGFGLTYAVIPGLIVAAVPDSETGSATGFYQVLRYIGFSLGSALFAAVLAAHSSGQRLPQEGGYTLAMWIATGLCAMAAALAWTLMPGSAKARAGSAVAGRLVKRSGTLAAET
jgi:predicted MFS family arabinose efflux permease